MTIAIILVSVAAALGIDAVLERRPWAWVLVRDTRVYRYYEHPDGRRRAECVGLGHQPLDREWLAGGEWTRPPTHLTGNKDLQQIDAKTDELRTKLHALRVKKEWEDRRLTGTIILVGEFQVLTYGGLDRALRAYEGQWVRVLFEGGASAEALVRDRRLAEWRLSPRARLSDLPARREGDPPASVVSWSWEADTGGEPRPGARPAPSQTRPRSRWD